MKSKVAMFVFCTVLSGLSFSSEPKVTPETVKGCYKLEMSPWKPDLHLKEDLKFITPPRRVELSLEHEETKPGSKGISYRLNPFAPSEQSIHQFTTWNVDDKGVVRLHWSTGFSGLQMQLHRDGTALKGTAYTFWDFNRTRQSADVTAISIPCAIAGTGIPK